MRMIKIIQTNFKEVNKKIEDHFSTILSSKIVENENDQGVNFNQFAKDVVTPRLTNEEQYLKWKMILQWQKLKMLQSSFRKTKRRAMTAFLSNFMKLF